MIWSSKIPTLLAKIPKLELDKYGEDVEIWFYLKIKPNLSAILNYIWYNFDILHDDPQISLLDEDDLYTLLRHKDIWAGQEDQILKAVWLWRSSKPIENNYHRIFSCLNWQFWTLDCILKMLYKFKWVRQDSVIKNLILLEFLKRWKKSQEIIQANKIPPRFRYKYVGGIKRASQNLEEDKFTDVFPFLIEDSSKPFLQRMFESLINIMKSAKITHQHNKIVSKSMHTLRGRNFSSDEEEVKESNNRNSNFIDKGGNNISVSEGECESENESSYDEIQEPIKSSDRYSIYNQLQDPNIDLHDLLNEYNEQRISLIQEREKLLAMLSKYNLGDNISKSKASVSNSEIAESHRDKISLSIKKDESNPKWKKEISLINEENEIESDSKDPLHHEGHKRRR